MNCPACGQPLPEGATAGYCPNCGSSINLSRQWPPTPTGDNPELVPKPPPNREDQPAGFILGCALTSLLGGLYGVGLLISALVYWLTRRSQPTFARGLGFGMAVGAALLLGLAAICYPSLRGIR